MEPEGQHLPILRPDLAIIPMEHGVQLRAGDEETWFLRTTLPAVAEQILVRLRQRLTRETLLADVGMEHAAMTDSMLLQLCAQNLTLDHPVDAKNELARYLLHFPRTRDPASLRLATVQLHGDSLLTRLLAANLEEHGVHIRLGSGQRGDEQQRIIASALACVWEVPDLSFALEINHLACELRVPCLFVDLSHGQHATVGPFFIPGEGACYTCFRSRLRQNTASPTELAAAETHMTARRVALPTYGTLPTFRYWIAGVAGAEIVAFLLRHRPLRTLNRIVTMNLEKLEMTTEPVWRVPWCPACAIPA